MQLLKLNLRVSLFVVSMLAMVPSGFAQSPEEFYKGKQLILINGNPPGDRGDVVARLVIKHMGSHIPGNPAIISQNMPAAGTLVAANYLYNVAPKDGTVFGNFSRSIPVQSIMGQASTNYDPRGFGWLGSPEATEQICVANASASVKNAQDLFTKELVVGSSGPTTVTQYLPAVLSSTLGMKFKIISGYGGSSDIFLAMDRGELDGICTVLNNIDGTRPTWIADGKVRVLFHTSTEASPDLPNVPSIYDYAKTEEQKKIIFFVNSGVEFGRPFATPPGIPADRLKTLRRAFAETMADPEFIADAKEIDLEVRFTSGERMDKMVDEIYATPKDLIVKSAAMMGFAKN